MKNVTTHNTHYNLNLLTHAPYRSRNCASAPWHSHVKCQPANDPMRDSSPQIIEYLFWFFLLSMRLCSELRPSVKLSDIWHFKTEDYVDGGRRDVCGINTSIVGNKTLLDICKHVIYLSFFWCLKAIRLLVWKPLSCYIFLYLELLKRNVFPLCYSMWV